MTVGKAESASYPMFVFILAVPVYIGKANVCTLLHTVVAFLHLYMPSSPLLIL